jgi:hypothetical protein
MYWVFPGFLGFIGVKKWSKSDQKMVKKMVNKFNEC